MNTYISKNSEAHVLVDRTCFGDRLTKFARKTLLLISVNSRNSLFGVCVLRRSALLSGSLCGNVNSALYHQSQGETESLLFRFCFPAPSPAKMRSAGHWAVRGGGFPGRAGRAVGGE